MTESAGKKSSSRLPVVKAKLLEGKRGLIVGIANDQSIAWGCAKAFYALGAEVAVTYLNEKAKRFVEPLAREIEAPILMPLDVQVPGQLEAAFERIEREWGRLDFLVHSIAFSPKNTLQGRVVDAPKDGFLLTMDISCWSFIRMAHLAEPLMKNGGTLFTMTYYGSQMVIENYNIMGVAKAALECAVRYLAAELGPKGIRVHAISPGPLATRAASGIPDFDALLDKAKVKAPARSLVNIDDVGAATAFLAHDAARLITGETLYIDGGITSSTSAPRRPPRVLIQIKADEVPGADKCRVVWQPISSAPFDLDLELAVIDRTEVHALAFPCRRIYDGWHNTVTKRRIDVRPTHWREWKDKS